jgi:uncharacterized protein (TIGR03083 family)
MRLTPRYDGPRVLEFDPPPPDPSVPLLRQRRRLVATLSDVDADGWGAPSRCAAWSNRDVVSHLVTVDAFWAASIAAGRVGQPTRMLEGFDPAVTPARLVEAAPVVGDDELLERLGSGVESLARALDGIDAAGWASSAEAPPGHLAIGSVVLHALWDAWVHERDILLPLGLTAPEEPDETAASLRYVAGLGPAIMATAGSTRTGAFGVEATGPGISLLVTVGRDVVVRDAPVPDGVPTLRGRAADLVDSLSLRAEPPTLPGEDGWMVEGMGALFDQAG